MLGSIRSLPLEVQDIVVQLVAVDRQTEIAYRSSDLLALCLVSKTLLKVTQPHLYSTILLAGRLKVSLLSRTFRERPYLSKTVKNLLVSDIVYRAPTSELTSEEDEYVPDGNEEEEEESVDVLPTCAFEYSMDADARLDRQKRLSQWLDAREQVIAVFRKSLVHILSLTAPALRTLALLFYAHYDRRTNSGLTDALDFPFPVLKTLTVRDDDFFHPFRPLCTPSLEDLVVAGGNATTAQWLLRTLSESDCPNLLRIRLVAPFIADSLMDGLANAILDFDDASPSNNKARVEVEQHPDESVEGGSGRPGQRTQLTIVPYLLRAPEFEETNALVAERLRQLPQRLKCVELEVEDPVCVTGHRYPLGDAIKQWSMQRDC